MQPVYGDEGVPSGSISLVQTLVSANSIGPNQNVTVNLAFAAQSSTSNFYNVELTYKLPDGAQFVSCSTTNFVSNYNPAHPEAMYDSATNTVTYKLRDPDPAIISQNMVKAGTNGNFQITFKFPSPSVYPTGATIALNNGMMSWNLHSTDGVAGSNESTGVINLGYTLGSSWEIHKSGPSTATISNNPLVTTLSLTYTITLSHGNIPLRDVIVTDTLPSGAVFVSSTVNTIGGSSSQADSTSPVIFTIPAVAAGGTSFQVTVQLPIYRGAGAEGIKAGDTATNKVTVTGLPNTTYGNDVKNKGAWNTPVEFVKDNDSCTTTFQNSGAVWGVSTTGPSIIYLNQDPTITETSPITYTVKISGGDTDLTGVVLDYDVPADATVTDSAGGTYDSANHKITWNIGALAGNAQATKSVVLTYPIDRSADGNGVGVSDSDIRENTAVARGYTGGVPLNVITYPDQAKVATTFKDSTAYWSAEKTGTTSITIPHSGDNDYVDATYTLRLKSNGTGNTPLESVTLTEILPQFSTYQSYTTTYSGTVNFNGDPAHPAWTFENVTPDNPPSVTVTIRFTVDRTDDGNDTGIKPGTTITNQMSATAEKIGTGGYGNGGSSVYVFGTGHDVAQAGSSTTGAATPNPGLSINIDSYTKNGSYFVQNKYFDVGDVINYRINFANAGAGGEKLYNAVLTDEALPAQINYETLTLSSKSAGTASVNYELYYKDESDSWIKASGSYNTGVSSTINIANLVGEGHTLKGIKLVYLEEIPAGYTFAGNVAAVLSGKVNNTALGNGAAISNGAKLDYQFRTYSGYSSNAKTDTVKFQVYFKTAYISKLSKAIVSNIKSQYQTLETLQFELKVANHGGFATDEFADPVLIDVVPKGFALVENSTIWSSTLGAGGLPQPTMTSVADYPNIGETTLIWSWPAGTKLKKGEEISLKYTMLIKSYAGIGTHYNKFYLYGSGTYQAPGFTSVTDTGDLNKNGQTNDKLLKSADVAIHVMETSVLSSTKWVKGILDSVYSKYPDKGVTTPGGTAEYKLEVFNAGNVYMDSVEIIDILPYIGDTTVVDPNTARGSQWRPYLVQKLPDRDLAVIDNVYTSDDKVAHVVVSYSTAYDPKRLDSNNQQIGTQEPNWSTTPPADITSVRSLKFVITNFNEGDPAHANQFHPGSKINLAWNMRAPVGAPVNQVAWNSISMSAANSSGVLPPAAPFKVGIVVGSNPKGEIGDFIWFDKNRNGIQDDGYDGQLAGVNGIKVYLEQYHEDGNHWTTDAMTLTGSDQHGNPGYYLFPNLETGVYRIAFELPEGYSSTIANQGSNPALNSKGTTLAGNIVRTASINIKSDGTGEERINHNQDLGLVAKTDEHASLILSKEAIGYRDTNGVTHNFNGTKVPVNKDETVLYKITVKNDGTLPVYHISLKDVLEGFSFKSLRYSADGGGSYTNSYAMNEDSNVVFASGTANSLLLNQMLPDSIYEFYGEYKVAAADIKPVALTNTVKLWANELNDQTDPTIPYKQASDDVDVAAMSIEKIAFQLKPSGQADFIAIDNVNTLGIEEGDTVRYRLRITNLGSTPLNNVTVNDPKLGFSNTIASIPVEEYRDQFVDYTATASDKSAGQIANTANATHTDIRYAVNDSEMVYFKGLSIDKQVVKINGQVPVPNADGKIYAHEGDEIEYKITFTNTGNRVLTNVVLTKDLLSGSRTGVTPAILAENVDIAATLAVGESKDYTITYKVLPGDIVTNGTTQTLHNQVFGKSEGTIEKQATADVELVQLTLEKTADLTYYRYVNQNITYTIKVKNIGSTKLHNVVVKDDMLQLNENIPQLAAGEVKTFTGVYKVVPQDISNRSIENVASAVSDETPDEIEATWKATYRPYDPPDPPQPPIPPVKPEQPTEPTEPTQPTQPTGPTQPTQPTNPVPPTTEKETTPQGTPKEGTVTVPEGGKPTVVTPPSHGTVTVDDKGKWIYTPDPDFKGKDAFTITITDPEGNTEDIFIEIDVEEVPLGAVDIPNGTLPKTGEPGSWPQYLIGAILLLTGLTLWRKEKMNKKRKAE